MSTILAAATYLRLSGDCKVPHRSYNEYDGLMALSPSGLFGLFSEVDKIKEKKGNRMSSEKTQNLQDVFLNHVRKQKAPVTVFLVNGVKLQGIITWFDNFCVLLRRDGHSQLVYKHAISTVMPVTPLSLYDDEDVDAGDDHIDEVEA